MRRITRPNTETTDSLRLSIKEFLDGINNKTDLLMLYGMARAAFNDKEAQEGGAAQ